MSQETVVVPDIGGSDAAEVVEILVSVGDEVVLEQGLLVLESDKASMEIPSTVVGTVLKVLAKLGDALGEGAPVALIEVVGSAVESEPELKPEPEPAVEKTPAPSSQPTPPADPVTDRRMEVPVPDIGTDEAVDVIEVSVKPGDAVTEGDTLVVLESDKASMEVPSPATGIVEQMHVSEGQSVKQGDPLLILTMSGAAELSSPDPEGLSAPSEVAPSTAAPARAPALELLKRAAPSQPSDTAPADSDASVYAGPAVRRLAREFGIPLQRVTASGPRGRVLKEDLHAYSNQRNSAASDAASGSAIPSIPEIDFASFGPIEVVQRSKIDKLTAANMQRNWLNVPHVTHFDDADITEMEAFRRSLKAEAADRGTRVTPMPFLLKACAVALRQHEKLNASLSDGGQSLTYKRYVHIGIAVDTPAGLVVPVVRDVDKKSLWELGDEVLDLAGRARDRRLKPNDMQGAGFTISSLGAIGGRGFTPIINAPEVAILGVGRSETRPVWDGGAFQPRLQLPLALSYDHRVVNGGDAGRFMTALCGLLGDIRRLLL